MRRYELVRGISTLTEKACGGTVHDQIRLQQNGTRSWPLVGPSSDSCMYRTRNTILAVPLALRSNLCITKYPHFYAGCWENTRKSHQNHEQQASGFELFLVFSQHAKCLYKSKKTWQRVSHCFYKITEHLPLCKNYLSKWSSFKLSRKLSNRALIQSESSTEVLTCIRGQGWIATRKYRRCSWKKLRTSENDAVEKWRESVSIQLYCQKLRVFICWSRPNVVDQCILQTCCRLKINISFPADRRFGRLAEAYTNFRQVRCHPFD